MIYIIDSDGLFKSSIDVLKTANRIGYYVDPEQWSVDTVYDVPFDKSFTKKELRDYLREIVFHCNDAQPKFKLKLKEIKIYFGKIVETDSLNLFHSGAYYLTVIELPDRAREFMEKSEEIYSKEQIDKKFQLDTLKKS